MAETIPVNFPIPQSSVLANYDWTDFIDGTGIANYYLAVSLPSGAATYERYISANAIEVGNYIIPTSIEGTKFSIVYRKTAGGAITNPNVDFALSAFNYPRVLRGKLNITFTVYINFGGTMSVLPKVSILLNSTELVSWTSAALTATQTTTFNINLTIPQTNAKIGDVLTIRFTSDNTSTSQAGSECICFIVHDPLNRDMTNPGVITAATNQTKLTASIPFKINL